MDARKSHLIVSALYSNLANARAAYDAVVPELVPHSHAGILVQERDGIVVGDDLRETLLEEEVKTGMAAGGALGALAGLVVGISTVAIPGVGSAIVAGPILTTLFGTGAGALSGGLVAALGAYGLEDRLLRFYEAGINEGGALVLTATENAEQADQVRERLARFQPILPEAYTGDTDPTSWKPAEPQPSA